MLTSKSELIITHFDFLSLVVDCVLDGGANTVLVDVIYRLLLELIDVVGPGCLLSTNPVSITAVQPLILRSHCSHVCCDSSEQQGEKKRSVD
jgi:hypothetical protein